MRRPKTPVQEAKEEGKEGLRPRQVQGSDVAEGDGEAFARSEKREA